MIRSNIIGWLLTLSFGLAIMSFGVQLHPELFSWHEQNQLFLMTYDYFSERMSVAGGLADYISEFLTQFYYYPTVGACVLAVVYVLLQLMLYAVLHCGQKRDHADWTAFILSFLPVTMLIGLMGDIDMMLCFPIALCLSLSTYLLCRTIGFYGQLLVIFPLYWLVGPVFVVQVFLAVADELTRQQSCIVKIIRSVLLLLLATGWVWLCRTLWIAQYPWDTVLSGINYYRLSRMTLSAPVGVYVIIFLTAMLPIIYRLIDHIMNFAVNRRLDWICAACFALIIVTDCVINRISEVSYASNDYAMLRQMSLLRKGDWQGVIAHAQQKCREENEFIRTSLSCNAINLALGMTQQMSSHMFEFPQTGIQGLIMPRVRDNVSNVTAMEVFWQLGFINESMRYAFDSQESISNCRKSARFTQRLVECNIINGKYDVASKYIDLLKQTLFYRDWAKQAETYLYDEDKIERHSVWALRRAFRLEDDFLYYYPEMIKMIGRLVVHNRHNRLAYDYFMAALLLEGNYQSFVANLPQQPKSGQDPFPSGYKQYVEYMQSRYTTVDAITSATAR